MLLTLVLLLASAPQTDVKAAPEKSKAPAVEAAKDSKPEAAPVPAPEEVSYLPGQLTPVALARAGDTPASKSRDAQPDPAPAIPFAPAIRGPIEIPSPAQRRTWYALTIVSSGAATFDAWTTRRAITQGYGREMNPTLRPFAGNAGLYAVIQASPLLMDYVGRRMMTSRYRLVRKMWWLPQSAGTAVSVVSGAHNLAIAP